MNNRTCFLEVEGRKPTLTWRSRVNEISCRVCFALGCFGTSKEKMELLRRVKETKEQVCYFSNPYIKGRHAEVIGGETICICH